MKFTDRFLAAQSKPALLAHVEFVAVVMPEAFPRISIDDADLTFPGLSKWFVALVFSASADWCSAMHSPGANVADGRWGHIPISDVCEMVR